MGTDLFYLTGKVALITGGTSGIGAATAILFAQEIVLQGKVELAHFGLIIISTATAVIVSRAMAGAETVFHARTFGKAVGRTVLLQCWFAP